MPLIPNASVSEQETHAYWFLSGAGYPGCTGKKAIKH